MPRTLLLLAAVLSAAVVLLAGPQPCRGADGSIAEREIEEALSAPTHLEFIETPLQDVVDYLKDYHQIEIQIDKKALDDVGLDASTALITKNLKGLSLRSALNLTLRDHKLTYLIQDEVLLITTVKDAAGRLTTKLYPVADLITSADEAQQERRRDELVHAITTSIEQKSWNSADGPGTIATTSFDRVPTLVVSQTYHVHRKIAAFLEEQRRVVRAGRQAAVPRCPVVSIRRTPAAEKIEKALKEPTELEFIETPLRDVMDYLKKKHKIEIQIDRKALDDVGLDPSTTPITKNLKGISLRSALRLIFRDLDLTYVIQDEVLLITTPEEAETRLTTRIYAVGDLSGSSGFRGKTVQPIMGGMIGMGMFSVKAEPTGDEDTGSPAESEARPSSVSAREQTVVPSSGGTLIEMITATVEPTSWDEVGGPGSIARVSFRGVDVLVVSQTQCVHEEILDLLDTLREAIRCSHSPAAPAAKPAAGKPTTDEPPKAPPPPEPPAADPDDGEAADAPAADPFGAEPAVEPSPKSAPEPPDDPFAN
jgi:hypothetical protein